MVYRHYFRDREVERRAAREDATRRHLAPAPRDRPEPEPKEPSFIGGLIRRLVITYIVVWAVGFAIIAVGGALVRDGG